MAIYRFHVVNYLLARMEGLDDDDTEANCPGVPKINSGVIRPARQMP